RIVEDVMRLELRYRSDIDLSQPAMQVEIRSHIARCLRDYPQGGEGVITLAGVEHCFMYVVHDDVVDTVIGPPDYIEQVLNERRQTTHEATSPLPRKEHNYPLRGPVGRLASSSMRHCRLRSRWAARKANDRVLLVGASRIVVGSLPMPRLRERTTSSGSVARGLGRGRRC